MSETRFLKPSDYHTTTPWLGHFSAILAPRFFSDQQPNRQNHVTCTFRPHWLRLSFALRWMSSARLPVSAVVEQRNPRNSPKAGDGRSWGKMRDADMECKVAFLPFHSLLFPRFLISLVTGHEPI